MSAVEPRVLAHYLAACAAAGVSPADLASGFTSAQDARDLMDRVAKLAIPDAARLLRSRMWHHTRNP